MLHLGAWYLISLELLKYASFLSNLPVMFCVLQRYECIQQELFSYKKKNLTF